MDQAVKEFFDYLKASGLYDNSVIVLYGDHYGISNSRNLKLASLLGKSSSTWSDFDNVQMQRVPFMIHVPGQENGGIFEQYGGEIDVMPTLLHLAGIDSKKYLLFGSDLFSKEHDQTVAFRNENFITPKYTVVGSTIYENSTGNVVTHPSKKVQAQLKAAQEHVNSALSLSDSLNNKNLLRFYVPTGFTPVDPKDFNYKNQVEQLDKIQAALKGRSTSLWSKNNDHTTADKYHSDAPELKQSDSGESTNEQAPTVESTLEDTQ